MSQPTAPPLLLGLKANTLRALVVGAGPVGRRRALSLLGAGANVTLVDPNPSADPQTWAAQHPKLTWQRRPFDPSDLDGVHLALTCTDDHDLNDHILAMARARKIWTNAAHNQHKGDLHWLASAQLGTLTLGISSAGAAPGLTKTLRTHLNQSLGPQWPAMAHLTGHLRQMLTKAHPQAPQERIAKLRRWQTSDALRLIAARDLPALCALIHDTTGLKQDPASLANILYPAAPPKIRPTLLLSGFGPFPGVSVNPSPGVARAVAALLSDAFDVQVIELPTHFEGAWKTLHHTLNAMHADPKRHLVGVFPFGVASGSKNIRLERMAINHRRGGRPDASGRCARPNGEPIIPSGPDGLMGRWSVDALVAHAHRLGHTRVEVSNSAGTYVCNEIFYRLMVWSNEVGFDGNAGFVHIPMVPESLANQEAADTIAAVLRQCSHAALNPAPH